MTQSSATIQPEAPHNRPEAHVKRILASAGIAAALALPAPAACAAGVELFSPQGEVKGVRQVAARFTHPMVPFGDPRLLEPFDVDCPARGRSRWADARNWVFDFDADLPAGIVCTFALKPGLAALDGTALSGDARFTFTTGGPAIRRVLPYEGALVDERQVFVLALDAPAREASIAEHAHCAVEGVNERIGVRVLTGEEKAGIVAQRSLLGNRFYRLVFEATPEQILLRIRERQDAALPLAVVQCRRTLPNGAQVRLVWGRGIAAAGGAAGGVATSADQSLAFRVRERFLAEFSCTRVNAQSPCVPVLPMAVNFSAPVARAAAARIRLRAEDGTVRAAQVAGDGAPFVDGVTFAAPLPERTRFRIELPEGLQDDAGRPLANASSYPLAVATDEAPPLAKFAGRFGILELAEGGVLPVTLRNVEPQVAGRTLALAAAGGAAIPGRALATRDDRQVIEWIKRLNEGGRPRYRRDPGSRHHVAREGEFSVFDDATATQTLGVPKPNGAKALEVVGIPLREPGFHVVELASPRLGAALHGEAQPYYVATGALVTNLAAHFKRGRESSLVWVTTLDHGRPVAGAAVAVRDCRGSALWEGVTGADGVAAISAALPAEHALPYCSHFPSGYYVSARTAGDMTFVLSAWSDGIRPWQFNLPTGSYGGPLIAHTVFDRTLFRAGESVGMKHFLRRHTREGIELLAGRELPARAVVRHQGSGEEFELPLEWTATGTAESRWVIPQQAKLGAYTVALELGRQRRLQSGSIRVEAFRVPTMKASIQGPRTPLVNATAVELDLLVAYLAGGGAGHAPVKLRSQVQPKSVSYPDYPDFVFGGTDVVEGVVQRGDDDASDDEESGAAAGAPAGGRLAHELPLTLDQAGAARARLDKLPAVEAPHDLVVEMEYQDANGETLAAATRIALWPARLNLGIRTEGWAASKDAVRFQVAALDLAGRPAAGAQVAVDLFQRTHYSHRKRLIGGFYAYEDYTETKKIGESVCAGATDAQGLLACQVRTAVAGELILRARSPDGAGNVAAASRTVYVVGADRWWFRQGASDRMDVVPEKKRYEPGEIARFQVRMPFAEATALVTVEREGVIEARVHRLAGRAPIVELPVQGGHAPNVYVSVLAVRGRLAPSPVPLADLGKGAFGLGATFGVLAERDSARDIRPKATVDLGKPAFRLGIAEINVGWAAHELAVGVRPERETYRVRETATVRVAVKRIDGAAPPADAEIALAAVDEGLLELAPNASWKLLEAMMQRRGIEVATATAQMQVVGKRHYGKKAAAPGGGGGQQAGRELFDTLLLWRGRVALDERGEARVEVPLNDSLSAFRIVAVASGASGLFGTGAATIRTTQDLMLLAGLPPVVREGDRFHGAFTVRNASDRKLSVELAAAAGTGDAAPGRLPPQSLVLAPGEAREAGWTVTAPAGAAALAWEVSARERGGDAADRIKVAQKVVAAHPVRTFQATLVQLDRPLALPVAMPGDAIGGRGGVSVGLLARLGDDLAGVREHMSLYPYTCLEQRASQAVALRDAGLWSGVTNALPSHLDRDGLAKYFASDWLEGSDVLTTYLLAIAHEAGWAIPDAARERMLQGLARFVEGRVLRYGRLPTADLAIRKIAAIEALARHGRAQPRMLDSIAIEPNLWPTSAVLDWLSLLERMPGLHDRAARRAAAESIVRARLNFQGTTMGFATERGDALWWLMISGDVNAVRAVLALADAPAWREDLPRMARGALGRRLRGHWNTTTANAWGVLAMEKFAATFEATPVAGATAAALAGAQRRLEWQRAPGGGALDFPWPAGQATLEVAHEGAGRPWATIASRAAIPLKAPFSSGYTIRRTVAPVEQKTPGEWSRGDVLRVALELEAQSDMTWVVVSDPIPAGAAILGTGLGRDSRLLARGERRAGLAWPAFEERGFEAFRAYYEFVPKGSWKVEYTVRLNAEGEFDLPATRVEAMYAPEMFGETPNARMVVKAR
ncbi:MAG: alpha-2-macroglobulin [Burkholderiales bacterium]|nr:alpha-2-macroglobulin [Burkholderiales bacterium]